MYKAKTGKIIEGLSMSDTVVLDPTRLVIAALVGLALLLVLIIKFKIHAMISILIGAITIGLVAGMPFSEIVLAVNDGIGNTLKGIALLVGLGSMFGAIFGSIWRCSDTGCNHGQKVWG